MARWIQAVGVCCALVAIHLAVRAQAPVSPVLFLADYCSDSSAWHGMLRNLPRQRFGGELIQLYQGADGGVYARGEREPAGSPSFALDFYDPSRRTFDAGVIAGIPIDRKVEQLRAAIDHIVGATGHSRVIVVAHGMGGLVARAYVQGRGLTSKGHVIPYGADVAALIAIDTPHAGVEIGATPPEWDRECAAADTVNRREMRPRRNPFLEALNRQPWPSGTRLDAIVSYQIGPNGDTDGLVSRTSQDIGSLSGYWEHHPDVHVWPQRFLDGASAAAGATMLHTAVVRSATAAALVNSIVEEVDSAQEPGVAGPRDHLDPHIESPHPYTNNYDNVWTWTAPGSPTALDVTFDPLTAVEANFDFIHVTDGAGTHVPGSPFTGTSLAGRTVRVPGATVRIRLTTDGSVTGYGFRIAVLTAVSSAGFPESPHPYTDNLDRTWSYTLPGSPAAIDVSFDPQTAVELNFDYIHVMDAAGTGIEGSPFTGTTLAGRTVRVRGSTVQVRLTSDASVTAYGFRVTNVAAAADTPEARIWTLSGTVRDARTNASLSGVTVLVTDGPNANRQTTTDGSGNYSLANLAQSGFSVRFSRSGYESTGRGVTLTQDTRLDINLQPAVQTWSLSGHVRDAQTGAPLDDVTILVTDGPNANRSTTTDDAGNYSLGSLQPGTFTARFSRSGYDSASRSVSLTQNTTLSVTTLTRRPAPATTVVIQPNGEGTTVCRGRVGPEPMAFGLPVVELERDTANIGMGGTVNLTARPIGPQADVTLRWYLLGRYGRLVATGCTARYEGPDSIGSAYMTSVDIAVQKDGHRRSPSGGTVHINLYDERNRLPECNAVVTVTVRGAQYGGMTRIDLQGVGTWFPQGARTFTLPVRVRRGLYTITVGTTGRSPAPRNINVGCPRTDVIFN